jgi:hypothetical protein
MLKNIIFFPFAGAFAALQLLELLIAARESSLDRYCVVWVHDFKLGT